LIRTGGWAVKDDAGDDIERWVCVITLGTLGDTDQVYFQQVDTVTSDNTSDIVLTGPVNQAIQFYSVDSTPAVITSIARSSNVVTVVTSTAHDLTTGQSVIISGVTGGSTSFNGTFANVTVTNSTTFTFAQTGGDESGTVSASSEAAGIAYDYSQFIQLFVREWQKTYASATLDDIGVTTLSYQAYRFPLANTADSKIAGLAVSEQAASGNTVSVSNASWTTGVVTITSNGHGFLAGDVVDVTGITPSDYNGTYTIASATTNTFTYALTADPGSYTSGGSVSGDIFNNMNITWYSAGQDETGFQTPTTAYFSVIIDADVSGTQTPNPSAEQIYAYVQAQLRKTTNINAGSGTTGNKVGKVVPEKLQFIGDDLYTLGISATYEGVYIADYAEADVNRLHFWGYGSAALASATISTIARATNTVTVTTSAAHGFTTGDNITISGVTGATTDFNGTFTITVTSSTEFTYSQTGTTESGTVSSSSMAAPAEYTNIQFPFTAILTLNFGTNLVTDADAIYKVFFTNDDAATSPLGYDFGTKNAIVVNDKSNNPMANTVSGASSVQLTYDYDGNTQRGAGSAGTNAPITVVAIGLERAQYVIATGTIIRSISNSVSLVAPLERNYDPGSV
jgi:hypothetical protein